MNEMRIAFALIGWFPWGAAEPPPRRRARNGESSPRRNPTPARRRGEDDECVLAGGIGLGKIRFCGPAGIIGEKADIGFAFLDAVEHPADTLCRRHFGRHAEFFCKLSRKISGGPARLAGPRINR